MESSYVLRLQHCHLCRSRLLIHPLFKKSGAKYCEKDGDFFVQYMRGRVPAIFYRPYDHPENPIPLTPLSDYVDDHSQKPTAKFVKSIIAVNQFVIKCNETGQVFYGLLRLAKFLGVSRGALVNHLNGITPTIKDRTYTRITESGEPYAKSSG